MYVTNLNTPARCSCTSMYRDGSSSTMSKSDCSRTRDQFSPALRPGDLLVPWGLVFGHRGPGTAAQVVVDVALAVANSATELAIPAPGTLNAVLRQEALAEALGRLRRR